MCVVVVYVKTVTVEATPQQQLDESHEVVQAAARLAGVSTHAVMAHARRLTLLQSETKTHASGFVGSSLGRVTLPGMDRGMVRSDGWRAATIGPDNIDGTIPDNVVLVTDGGAGEAAEQAAITQEEIDRDVATLQQFILGEAEADDAAVPDTTGVADIAPGASTGDDLPPCDADPMSGSS